MEIYIIRHGETPWNQQKLLQGRSDIELNENGENLAKETGYKLKDINFDIIFSSPLKRAYKTACLLRGHRDIPIKTNDNLMEICFGEYEGKKSQDLRNDPESTFKYFFDKPELYRAPKGAETLEDVCKRAAEFLENEIEPNEDKYSRIMIVAHGALNKALMCHIKNHDIKDYWSGGLQKNCGSIIVNLENGKYTVIEE